MDEMTPIWKNPVGWTASMVASPTRFWLMVTLLLIFYALALAQAHFGEARSMYGIILLLGAYQLMFLYALRKLYQEVRRLRIAGAA
jgi:hypothetical protein